jgi:hypothetical protein
MPGRHTIASSFSEAEVKLKEANSTLDIVKGIGGIVNYPYNVT